MKKDRGQCYNTRKAGEEEYNNRTFDAVCSQSPDVGISQTGAKTPEYTDQCRQGIEVETRFDHKQSTNESNDQHGPLETGGLFF